MNAPKIPSSQDLTAKNGVELTSMPVLWSDRSPKNRLCHPFFCKNETVAVNFFVDIEILRTVANGFQFREPFRKAAQIVDEFQLPEFRAMRA